MDLVATTAASELMRQLSGVRLLSPSRRYLFATVLVLGGSLLLGAELLRLQVGEYGVLLASGRQGGTPAALLLGVLLGGVTAHFRRDINTLLWALSAWSLCLSLGALGLFFGVGLGLSAVVLPAHAVLQAALLTTIALLSVRHFYLRALQLGMLPALIAPSRICGIATLAVGFLIASSRAGLSATPFLLSLLVAGSIIPATMAATYVGAPPTRRHGPSAVVSVAGAALLGLIVLNHVISREEAQLYPGHVLFATGDQNSQRVVMTSGKAGLEVFVDRRAHIASLDRSRYVAALAALPSRRRRVLVFEAGSGSLTAHVLRQPGVEQVVVVSPSDNLARLQRKIPRLRELGENWLSDPRVTFEIAEPLSWLRGSALRFDVVVADFPTPLDSESSKYLTSHAFRLLTEHLLPRGSALVAGVGESRFPTSFGALQALAGENEVIQVGVPSLGEWSVVRLHADRPATRGVSTLDSPTVASLFSVEYQQSAQRLPVR